MQGKMCLLGKLGHGFGVLMVFWALQRRHCHPRQSGNRNFHCICNSKNCVPWKPKMCYWTYLSQIMREIQEFRPVPSQTEIILLCHHRHMNYVKTYSLCKDLHDIRNVICLSWVADFHLQNRVRFLPSQVQAFMVASSVLQLFW